MFFLSAYLSLYHETGSNFNPECDTFSFIVLLQYLKIIMKNAISSSSLMVDAKIHCTVCPKYLR